MTLHQLRIFHTVVRLKSISLAAETLYISQPSVSLQLKGLERSLGVQLVDRSGGRLVLTEAGQVLFRAAEAMLQLENDALRDLNELRGIARGRVVVGASKSAGIYLVPALLRDFRRANPEVTVGLRVDRTSRLCDLVQQGMVDLGIAGGPIDSRLFQVRRLLLVDLVAIVCSLHPWAGRLSVQAHEFAEAELVLSEPGTRRHLFIESRFKDIGISLRPSLQIPTTEAVKIAVEAGLGVGLVPQISVEQEVRDGRLHAIHIEGVDLLQTIDCFTRRSEHLRSAVYALRDYTISYFEGKNAKYDGQRTYPRSL